MENFTTLEEYMRDRTNNFTSTRFLKNMEKFKQEDELRESIKKKIETSS